MMKLSVCSIFCRNSEAQGAKRSFALKIRRVRKLSFLSRNTNILYLMFLDGTIVPQLLATQHSKYDFIEFKSPAARTPIPPPVTIIGTRRNPYLSVFSRCCVIQNHWFLKLENKFYRPKCPAFMSAYRDESFFPCFGAEHGMRRVSAVGSDVLSVVALPFCIICCSEETGDERTYRNWMNSLGVQPRVNRLYG